MKYSQWGKVLEIWEKESQGQEKRGVCTWIRNWKWGGSDKQQANLWPFRTVLWAKTASPYPKLGDFGVRKEEFPSGIPGPKHLCENLRTSVCLWLPFIVLEYTRQQLATLKPNTSCQAKPFTLSAVMPVQYRWSVLLLGVLPLSANIFLHPISTGVCMYTFSKQYLTKKLKWIDYVEFYHTVKGHWPLRNLFLVNLIFDFLQWLFQSFPTLSATYK